jgi:3-methyladenine DNA glycosylase AlkD
LPKKVPSLSRRLTVTANEITRSLDALGNPDRARMARQYFKTGPGEYGEGDIFLGVSVPETRKLAGQHRNLPLPDAVSLLHSPIHEARMCALLILCRQYARADAGLREQIYQTYLDNTRFINNWDLVDLTAKDIVGVHLETRPRDVLYRLVSSPLLWERRIAIMATFHYIRLGDFSDTLAIARHLVADREDLIHKAVGWMLREVGKRDLSVEEAFLSEYYRHMPRTMLRYAIERFPEDLRQRYLHGRI